MTQERILELAYIGAMKLWDAANINLRKGENDIRVYVEQRRWEELEEISKMLIESNL